MRRIGFILVGFTLLVAAGCRDYVMKSDRIVIADCYGNKLYAEDLEGVVPAGASKMDSLSRVNAFIDSWIKRQILVHQAEVNLSPDQLDFTKQMLDYRNSLVIYAYETQLVEQYLDTVVSDDEIAAFYEENKANFQLRSTMVKVAYVVFEEGNKHKKDFQKLMSDRDTLLISKLDALAEHDAVSSFLDVDTWVRLDDLLETIPLEIFNTESFLKRNRFVTFEKDGYVYMLRFEDYLMAESVSPIEIEKENIKKVILMKRQKELLARMTEDLYEKALKDKVFEIY